MYLDKMFVQLKEGLLGLKAKWNTYYFFVKIIILANL
jgi:hypothetical protein